jgi:hypothetical protein
MPISRKKKELISSQGANMTSRKGRTINGGLIIKISNSSFDQKLLKDILYKKELGSENLPFLKCLISYKNNEYEYDISSKLGDSCGDSFDG